MISKPKTERSLLILFFCVVALFFQGISFASASISYHAKLSSQIDVVIDVRPESDCLQQALPLSVCLPTEHLLADHNRLANFSGLFWLLGTLGLSGSEHIAIVGNKSQRRDFIAGVFFIAGQSRIDVLTQPLNDLLNDETTTARGQSRAATRTKIYTAESRTDLLLLKSELVPLLSLERVPLLDGRLESEYWGRSIRASRGGHLPGAIHARTVSQLTTQSGKLPIAYAHDAPAGLSYLSRLAAQNIDVRLYLGGWSEWAGDSTLPVDAETFLDPLFKPAAAKTDKPSTSIPRTPLSMVALAVLLIAVGSLAYCMGRTHRGVA